MPVDLWSHRRSYCGTDVKSDGHLIKKKTASHINHNQSPTITTISIQLYKYSISKVLLNIFFIVLTLYKFIIYPFILFRDYQVFV